MFKTSKISFCNKQACNIVEDSFKEEILDILQTNYYVSIKDKNFHIINPKNIKYIEKNPNFLSVKSSGSLYYLFLTRIENKNYCFFIDKKIKEGHKCPRIISINYRFSDELFTNTLFDGELLRDKDDNWLYIINNLVIYKAKLMKDKKINYKLNVVYDILTNNYQKDDNLEICPLYVKRLFANHEFSYMIKNYIPNLNYNCRGIYFEGIRNMNNHLFLIPRGHKFGEPQSNTNTSIQSNTNDDNRYNTNGENRYNTNDDNHDNLSNTSVQSNTDNRSNTNGNKMNQNIKTNKKKIDISGRDSMIFLVRNTKISDIYNIYCLKDDEIYKYGGAHINNLKTSKYMIKCFNEGQDNITMRCEYNNKMEKWKPIEVTNEPVDDVSTVEEFLKNM